MSRNFIPGIDDEYKFTRPEYAKLLGISTNALRMKMRKGGFGEEYVVKNGKYVFKRPRVSKEERPSGNTDPYQVIKEKNYTYKKPVKRGTHFENNYTSDAMRKHNEFKMYNKIKDNVGQEVLDEINPEVMKIAQERANAKRKKSREIADSFNTARHSQRNRVPIPIDSGWSNTDGKSYFIGRVPKDEATPYEEEPIRYIFPTEKKEPEYKMTNNPRLKHLEDAIKKAKK